MAIERTAAQKLQEVSALLAVPNSRITAGGTTFPQDPEEELHLVDISALEGLDSIKQKGSRIEIGPLVTLKTLAGNKLIHPCPRSCRSGRERGNGRNTRQRHTWRQSCSPSPRGHSRRTPRKRSQAHY